MYKILILFGLLVFLFDYSCFSYNFPNSLLSIRLYISLANPILLPVSSATNTSSYVVADPLVIPLYISYAAAPAIASSIFLAFFNFLPTAEKLLLSSYITKSN